MTICKCGATLTTQEEAAYGRTCEECYTATFIQGRATIRPTDGPPKPPTAGRPRGTPTPAAIRHGARVSTVKRSKYA